jgi:hypothetical protein
VYPLPPTYIGDITTKRSLLSSVVLSSLNVLR